MHEKQNCFLCGSGRIRNLIQVEIQNFPVADGEAKAVRVLVCIRCLLVSDVPVYPNQARYVDLGQKKAVNRFKNLYKSSYDMFKLGSDGWFAMNIEEFERHE